MENNISPSIHNNFDLIRLLAAIQVVFRHTFYKYDFQSEILNFIKELILAFPGVPIFFMVSGFLIYWSFDRNSKNVKNMLKIDSSESTPLFGFVFLLLSQYCGFMIKIILFITRCAF